MSKSIPTSVLVLIEKAVFVGRPFGVVCTASGVKQADACTDGTESAETEASDLINAGRVHPEKGQAVSERSPGSLPAPISFSFGGTA